MRARGSGALVLVVAGLLGAGGVAGAEPARCERGEFCLWAGERYRGAIHRVSLATDIPGECLPLPIDARSFVNRTSRPVTVYQGRECATEGEFDTYPGGGTYVPVAPYLVRAVQIWEG